MDNTLVLNKNWTAIHICDWQRAISLLYTGLAKAVDTETYKAYDFREWADLSKARAEGAQNVVHSVNLTVIVPDVIVLVTFNKVPVRHMKLTRKNVFERDNNTCIYCGKKFRRQELSLEHIVPRAYGGVTEWGNVACCCSACNIFKGGRTPEEAGLKLHFKPYKPAWKGVPLFSITQKVSWKNFIDAVYWNTELEQ